MSSAPPGTGIWSEPAALPPPGVTPNFENPANLQAPLYSVTIILFLLVTFVVWIRMYTKWRLLRNFVVEDWILLVTWLIYTFGYNVLIFIIAGLPGGVHTWNLTNRQIKDASYYFHVTTIIYGLVVTPLKVSIVLQFLRVFAPKGTIRGFTFWSSHALIWLNVVFYIAYTIALLFGCQPFAKNWDPSIKDYGYCIDIKATHIAAGVFNTLSDVVMLIIPVHAVYSLRLPKPQKQVLFSVFTLGSLACLFAILRLHHTIELHASSDMSFHSVVMGIWSIPEIAAGFCVACAGTVRTFFTRQNTYNTSTRLPAWSPSSFRIAGFSLPCFGSRFGRGKPSSLASTSSSFSSSSTYKSKGRAITHVTYEERRNGSYCEAKEIERTDWALKSMEAGVDFGNFGHRGPPKAPEPAIVAGAVPTRKVAPLGMAPVTTGHLEVVELPGRPTSGLSVMGGGVGVRPVSGLPPRPNSALPVRQEVAMPVRPPSSVPVRPPRSPMVETYGQQGQRQSAIGWKAFDMV